MPKDSILLHPKKGVNPRIMACAQCGASCGVALLGRNEYVYECSHGNKCIGGRPNADTYSCGCTPYQFHRGAKIDDTAVIPGGLCDKCQQENTLQADIVKEGGIYFKCADCNERGAIRKNEFTEAVRKHAGVYAPDPLGIEFTKNDCPICTKVVEVPTV